VLKGAAMADKKRITKRPPFAAVFLCISIVVLLWTVLLYDLKRSEDANLEQGRKDVGNLTIAFREYTTGVVNAIDQLLIAIAADHARNPDEYHIPDWVEKSPMLHGLTLQVGMTGPDGIVKVSNLPIKGRVDLSDRPHVRYHFEPSAAQPYISVPVLGRVSGKWSIQFTRRLNRINGGFDGVVIVSVDPYYLSKFFDSVDLGKYGSATLVGRDGIVRARQSLNNQKLGQDLSNSTLFQELRVTNAGTYRAVAAIDGIERIYGFASLQSYPLVVAIGISTDQLLMAVHNQRNNYLIFGGFATIAIIVVTLILVRESERRRRHELALHAQARVEGQKAQLDAALDNMSQGLVMFDSAARLVICNDRYRQIYDLSPDLTKPGCAVVDLLKHRVANGTFFGNPEKYVGDLLAVIAQGGTAKQEVETSDGRIISVVNQPMVDGGWVATHEDVTEARRSEESFRLLFEGNPVPMWVFDLTSLYFLAVNEAAIEHYGYSREQFLKMTILDIRPPEERQRVKQILRTHGGDLNAEESSLHQKLDGTKIYVAIYARRFRYEGRAASIIAAIDITERKRGEDELARTKQFLDTVIENVPVPIVVKEPHEHRYTLVNRASEECFGIPRSEMIGKTVQEIFPETEASADIAYDKEALQSDKPLTTDTYLLHTPHNGVRLLIAKRVAIRKPDGKPEYLLTVIDDVTERKRAVQRIEHMAHYDTLTDLPNRATFNETLDITIDRAGASGERFAVLSIDLDRFKEANDTYGHLVGDALLSEVARRLQVATEGAFIARIGGDEFMLIVADGAQPIAAAVLAERLIAAFVDDFEVEGYRLKLSLSIGGAVYPTDGTDAEALMSNADAALYRAKAEFRGSALFYESELGNRMRERQAMQEDLRSAIDRGELLLHYQPQVTMSGKTVGFEALVRWQCPKRGMVAPGTFIPIAEESSLIISLGEWVLREACREAASWPAPLTIAVNISPIQFRHGDLPRLVHSILLETGLAPGRLELEVTESVMINDFSRAVSILNRLKSLGVRIAMDDFGTGYSSLSYLQSFRCDKIKIDRTFICDLEHNHHSRAIVRAVIGLGRSLNLPILAEGVETEAEHAFLVQEGCDEVQGYLTGRPLPIADYAELVGRQTVAEQNYAVAGS
jgi:diguanylate cyclase (GGDEF)-like protein/PAS domain S-box-containing protein